MNRYAIAAVAALVGALTAGLVVRAQTNPEPTASLSNGSYDCEFETDAFICTKEVVPSTTLPPVTSTSSTTTSTTASTTSTTSPTTTTSSTTTTTVPVTTTTAPASTTTSSSSTTSSSTSTTLPPTTSTQPPGVAFSEDFSTASAFQQRFDFGWSGEVQAGALFGDAANDWRGDHDLNCGDPNTTSRNIHVTPPAGEPGAPAGSVKDVSQAFYYCAPGSDPARGHVMTSMNTEGYVTVWFAPKQTFHDVSRVCWDQNLTDMVGSTWTGVNFLTPAEYVGETDLGYTTLDFPDGNGPSSPQGDARFGVSGFGGGRMQLYNDGAWKGTVSVPQVTDKAGRYQHCVRDNENGTVTLSIVRAAGGTSSVTTSGQIPNGDIKVEFIHDAYNPDKHQEPPVARDSSGHYTWHWDNIRIEE